MAMKTSSAERRSPMVAKSSPTSAIGAPLPVAATMPAKATFEQAVADDQAGREQHAHALGEGRVAALLGAPVVELAEHRADHHRQGHRHRQIDADADRERRQAQQLRPAERRVEDDRDHADRGAEPIIVQLRSPPSTPLASAEISAACGAASASGPTPGRAGEAVGGVEHVEHRRDDQRAEDHADRPGRPAAATASRRPAGRSSDPGDCRWRWWRCRTRSPVMNRA